MQQRMLCSSSGDVWMEVLLPLAAMQRAAAKPLAPPARDTQPLCKAWQMQKPKKRQQALSVVTPPAWLPQLRQMMRKQPAATLQASSTRQQGLQRLPCRQMARGSTPLRMQMSAWQLSRLRCSGFRSGALPAAVVDQPQARGAASGCTTCASVTMWSQAAFHHL